jgi:SAM-dependent methyltransferase
MQKRQIDRKQYFEELAVTSKDFYLPYIRRFTEVNSTTRILEVGCGEGGNLLPFAQIGCSVTGVDMSPSRIVQAKEFFAEHDAEGTFINCNFLETETPTKESDKYDIVLMHDVIEHIDQPFKVSFIQHVRAFMKANGVFFCGFPAWQMPFGGHQQICKGFASHVPFIHLLPLFLYKAVLKMSGEGEGCVNELLSIRRSKMTIEAFNRLIGKCNLRTINCRLWLINPHYLKKFGLKPRRLNSIVSHIPYLRDFFSTSCFYMLTKKKVINSKQ